MSARILIDATTILLWERAAVGVVRVEEQLVRWALGQADQPIAFCRYDRKHRTFVGVPRERVAARIALFDRFGRDTPAQPAAAPVQPRKRSLKRLVRRAAKRLKRWTRTLAGIRPQPEPPAAKRAKQAPHAAPITCVFQNNDTYVSVGNDWCDKDLQRLYHYKKRLSLTVIGICYDTIPFKFPHLTVERIRKDFPGHLVNLAWTCDHVMCISACTQRDFLDFIRSVDAPAPATSVITLGNDLSRRTDSASRDDSEHHADAVSAAAAQAARKPFILFVSTIEPRKNHRMLCSVWARLVGAGCDVPDLVCVGMNGWGMEGFIESVARDERISDRIHFLHGISDADLAYLYKACRFTVYPSLYEGWGLPVAESLAFGKFCLSSNGGSLPEAGGSFAEYLDPGDVDAWAERIRYFAEHPGEVDSRNRRAASHFEAQSWAAAAEAILRITRQAAHTNG
jgi:hypothetical protein